MGETECNTLGGPQPYYTLKGPKVLFFTPPNAIPVGTAPTVAVTFRAVKPLKTREEFSKELGSSLP